MKSLEAKRKKKIKPHKMKVDPSKLTLPLAGWKEACKIILSIFSYGPYCLVWNFGVKLPFLSVPSALPIFVSLSQSCIIASLGTHFTFFFAITSLCGTARKRSILIKSCFQASTRRKHRPDLPVIFLSHESFIESRVKATQLVLEVFDSSGILGSCSMPVVWGVWSHCSHLPQSFFFACHWFQSLAVLQLAVSGQVCHGHTRICPRDLEKWDSNWFCMSSQVKIELGGRLTY